MSTRFKDMYKSRWYALNLPLSKVDEDILVFLSKSI